MAVHHSYLPYCRRFLLLSLLGSGHHDLLSKIACQDQNLPQDRIEYVFFAVLTTRLSEKTNRDRRITIWYLFMRVDSDED